MTYIEVFYWREWMPGFVEVETLNQRKVKFLNKSGNLVSAWFSKSSDRIRNPVRVERRKPNPYATLPSGPVPEYDHSYVAGCCDWPKESLVHA